MLAANQANALKVKRVDEVTVQRPGELMSLRGMLDANAPIYATDVLIATDGEDYQVAELAVVANMMGIDNIADIHDLTDFDVIIDKTENLPGNYKIVTTTVAASMQMDIA